MSARFPRKLSRFAIEVIEWNAKEREKLRISYEDVRAAIRVCRRYRNVLRKEEPWATESIRILADAIAELGALVPEDE